jgi:hypothetical protein
MTESCPICKGTGFSKGKICTCITGELPDELPEDFGDIFGGLFGDILKNPKKKGDK